MISAVATCGIESLARAWHGIQKCCGQHAMTLDFLQLISSSGAVNGIFVCPARLCPDFQAQGVTTDEVIAHPVLQALLCTVHAKGYLLSGGRDAVMIFCIKVHKLCLRPALRGCIFARVSTRVPSASATQATAHFEGKKRV